MPSAEHLFLGRMPSPIGTMLIVFDTEDHLRALDWEEYEARAQRLLRLHYGPKDVALTPRAAPDSIAEPLRAYFAGDLHAVDRIAVRTGGTPFQRQVWAALRTIPAGTTTTYGALAAVLERPQASRAVGAANGANPICIVVPCHRVVGTTGLTGYGGGLPRKEWLLRHEGIAVPPPNR